MKRNKFIRLVGLILLVSVILALSSGLASCSPDTDGADPAPAPEEEKKEGFDAIALGMTEDEVEALFGEFEATDDTFRKTGLSSLGEVAFLLKVERLGYENCSFGYFRSKEYHRVSELDAAVMDAVNNNESVDKINELYEAYQKAVLVPYSMTRFTFDKKGKLIEAFMSGGHLVGDNTDYGEADKVARSAERLGDEELCDGGKIAVKITFDNGEIYIGYAEVVSFSEKTITIKYLFGREWINY